MQEATFSEIKIIKDEEMQKDAVSMPNTLKNIYPVCFRKETRSYKRSHLELA